MAQVTPERLERDVELLLDRGLDPYELKCEAAARLTRAVPADAWCVPSVDPFTLATVAHTTCELPRQESWRLHRNEYGERDVGKHRQLAAGPERVSVLSEATGGDLERSPRFRTLLRPTGIAHELRAAVSERGVTWSFFHLYRRSGRDFDADEAGLAARVAPLLARGLRAAMLGEAMEVAPAAQAPVLLVLGPDGELVEASAGAQTLLAQLRDPELTSETPEVLISLAAWARVLTRAGESDVVPRARVPVPGGWLTLHASVLRGPAGGSGRVALMAQPAHPSELEDLLLSGFGFTPGEREVVALVLGGRSTKEIAAELYLSPHTVQDRLKGVFEKAGVRSRRELVARLRPA